MKDVKRDFHSRLDEINRYFSFLEKAGRRDSKLSWANVNLEKIEPALAKILKANGFLLLYNLVESSIKKAIEEIYFSMQREGVKFDDIKDSIKKEIVNHLRSDKTTTDKFVSSVNNIAQDIIEHCFPSDKIFSGSVDGKKIKEIAGRYGFSTHTNTRKTKGGKELLTVKSQRNYLAHGEYSFQEIGKDFSVQDMLRIKKEVTAYLEQILNNVEDYISKKEFLK